MNNTLPPVGPLVNDAIMVPLEQPRYDFIFAVTPLQFVNPDTIALTLDDGAAGFGFILNARFPAQEFDIVEVVDPVVVVDVEVVVDVVEPPSAAPI